MTGDGDGANLAALVEVDDRDFCGKLVRDVRQFSRAHRRDTRGRCARRNRAEEMERPEAKTVQRRGVQPGDPDLLVWCHQDIKGIAADGESLGELTSGMGG